MWHSMLKNTLLRIYTVAPDTKFMQLATTQLDLVNSRTFSILEPKDQNQYCPKNLDSLKSRPTLSHFTCHHGKMEAAECHM